MLGEIKKLWSTSLLYRLTICTELYFSQFLEHVTPLLSDMGVEEKGTWSSGSVWTFIAENSYIITRKDL